MPEIHKPIGEIQEVLRKRALPTITRWNRLEGRPRTHHFDRALKAEVRDALWMLTRQWQLGELKGDDAGSPAFAKVHVVADRLGALRTGSTGARPFDPGIPLEAQVERHSIPFELSKTTASLDVRLLLGREWIKSLGGTPFAGLADKFKRAFPVIAPDHTSPSDDLITAQRSTWQRFAALSGGRAMDGFAWLKQIGMLGTPRDYAVLAPEITISTNDFAGMERLCDRFIAWYRRMFLQPEVGTEAWQSDRLEYRFGCDTGGKGIGRTLNAKEYYHGHLDWYCLDLSRTSLAGDAPAQRTEVLNTSLPTPIGFSGMPNTRWWKFEDQRVNFAGITPDSTDIVKLLVMEFGLVYANDWFTVPVRLDVGQWCEVKGLVVTNVFGERLWIDPASRDTGTPHDWTLFTLADEQGKSTSPLTGLLLLPTVPKVQEGKALEEFVMVRDEMANMVWAMETVVPMADGRGRPGKEVASELRTRLQSRLDRSNPPPPDRDIDLRYRLMNSVPEHWIPFISAHMPGDTRQTRLQRASMPRILRNDPARPRKVKPRGQLLREGLDADPQRPLFIHEEEVPRAGVVVARSFQRTRWTDGQVVVWMGMRKQTGRGEGSSGLRFDLLQPKKELFQPLKQRS